MQQCFHSIEFEWHVDTDVVSHIANKDSETRTIESVKDDIYNIGVDL